MLENATLYKTRPRDRAVSLLFVTIALMQVGIRFVKIHFEWATLFYDAKENWLPIAQQMANGEVLYVTTMHDNKTPLWFALDYLVYLTGQYEFVFFALVGIANATVAYLIWRWCRGFGYSKGGVIAGVLWLSTLPLNGGLYINVRSFALVFLLLAILSTGAFKRGVYTAIAVLFSQFSVFAIPILLIDGYIRADDAQSWILNYCITGLGVGGVVFAVTALVYSPESAINGFKDSFLGAGDYVTSHGDAGNPFKNPKLWLKKVVQMSRKQAFVLIPFVMSGAAYLYTRRWEWNTFTVALCLSVAFLFTLVLKGLPGYWIPPMAFCATVAGIGVEDWIKN